MRIHRYHDADRRRRCAIHDRPRGNALRQTGPAEAFLPFERGREEGLFGVVDERRQPSRCTEHWHRLEIPAAMFRRHHPRSTLALLFLVLAGCQSGNPVSRAIADQFSASGDQRVDLASVVPGAWERVCILGPYSDDAAARRTLGFQWPAELLTDIALNEGISLLVFVKDGAVTDYVEHPRRYGDFTNLSGRCFPRSGSKFVQAPNPAKGWPGLFPEGEA